MTDALVEAVARAICADNEPQSVEDFGVMAWQDYRTMARAAIAAIAEQGFVIVPLDGMDEITSAILTSKYASALAARPKQ